MNEKKTITKLLDTPLIMCTNTLKGFNCRIHMFFVIVYFMIKYQNNLCL